MKIYQRSQIISWKFHKINPELGRLHSDFYYSFYYKVQRVNPKGAFHANYHQIGWIANPSGWNHF